MTVFKVLTTGVGKDSVVTEESTRSILRSVDFGWVECLKTGKRISLVNIEHKGQIFVPLDRDVDVQTDKDLVVHPDVSLPSESCVALQVKHKIPVEIFISIRKILGEFHKKIKTEAVVFVMYDKVKEEFRIMVPEEQKLSAGHYEIKKEYVQKNMLSDINTVVAAEFHSHPFGKGNGFFSADDNSSVPTIVTRVYGNITFDPNSLEFGTPRCKWPGMNTPKAGSGFLPLDYFFEEVPERDFLIDEEPLPEEILKNIEAVVDFNKKPTFNNVYQGGGWHRHSWNSGGDYWDPKTRSFKSFKNNTTQFKKKEIVVDKEVRGFISNKENGASLPTEASKLATWMRDEAYFENVKLKLTRKSNHRVITYDFVPIEPVEPVDNATI